MQTKVNSVLANQREMFTSPNIHPKPEHKLQLKPTKEV